MLKKLRDERRYVLCYRESIVCDGPILAAKAEADAHNSETTYEDDTIVGRAACRRKGCEKGVDREACGLFHEYGECALALALGLVQRPPIASRRQAPVQQ